MSTPIDPLANLQGAPFSVAAPVRILVADDASDSQLIVKTYLKDQPFDLKFVDNGKQAVEEFQSAPYDLVLMDMQMPEMDGLAATKAIRSIERGQGREPTPIVAFTASSDPMEVRATLLAGCTSYCCKPVSREALLQAIQRHCQGVADDTPPCDVIQVHPPESLEAIAPRYLASRRRELPDLERLLAASDWDRLERLGHNMKGSGRAYGFSDLTTIGTAIERAAKASDRDTLAEQLLKLSVYLSRVALVTA